MKHRFLGAGLLLALSTSLCAAESTSWSKWAMQTVRQHPTMQAYTHQMTASEYSAAAMARPLYNPSFDSSLEREGDETNFQVGLSSDIDWWDVKQSRTGLGDLMAQQGRLGVTIITNDLLAELMRAQVQAEMSEQAYEIARLQVRQDLQLLELTRAQLDAGEVSHTEVAMAKAVVGQGMVSENERMQDWLDARQALRALAGEQAMYHPVSEAFWQQAMPGNTPIEVARLPALQQARINWLSAQADADIQLKSNKPVPNIGVGVGRQAGESLVSLNVSLPLQWRNDYSEVNDAAREAALASEQEMHALMRSTKETLDNAALRLNQTKERFLQWQALHEDDLANEVKVLQSRYAQGDLSLSDYQWQVQQLRDGMQAGLTLKGNFQLARIEYLHITARLANHISSLNSQEQ